MPSEIEAPGSASVPPGNRFGGTFVTYRRLDTLFHRAVAEHLEGTAALLRGFLG